jgi:hypothetical protein
MNKKEGLFLDFFDLFYHNVKENFIKNYDGLIKFIDEKIKINKDNKNCVIIGGFYNMSVNVDYVKLKEKLMAVKKIQLR